MTPRQRLALAEPFQGEAVIPDRYRGLHELRPRVLATSYLTIDR